MTSSDMLATSRRNAGRDYLDHRFFLLTLLGAALLHIAGVCIWSLMPRMKTIDIPVRVLNIKLSDDTMTEAELKAIQPDTSNNTSAASTTVSQLSHYQNKQKEREQTVTASMDKAMSDLDKNTVAEPSTTSAPPPPAKPAARSRLVVKGKFNVRSEGTKTAAPVFPVTARQYVRDDQVQAAASDNGKKLSNPEMVSRYEKLISLWIQKFKTYPAEARKQSMQGETVVRIRIDRQGNILYYVLEHSTGSPLLDHAAIDMIKRANPVPAVPADYPPGDLLEFLIPVSFHLEP